jgi:hypothetical protein
VGSPAVRQPVLDACLTLATQPSTPAGFSATAAGEVDCLDHVDLAWTATAVGAGGGFLQYEVDRDDGSGWQRIANITTESVEAMADYEGRRNVAADYRIRVRRVDLSVSPWSATESATATMDCCGYLLTTNVDPALTLWADDPVDGERTYDFQPDWTYREFQGRDYRIGFTGLEKPGVRFNTTLLLAGEGGSAPTAATTTPGVATFDAIRAFLPSQDGAGLPYVAVLTEDGDRWLAAVEVTEGVRREPSGTYEADVIVTEVTATPTPIDVTP